MRILWLLALSYFSSCGVTTFSADSALSSAGSGESNNGRGEELVIEAADPALEGVRVTFPVGSLAIDANPSIRPGEDISANAASASVVIEGNEAPLNPFTIQLPIRPQGLALTSGSMIAVHYRAGKQNGKIHEFTLKDNLVTFEAREFGVYQAVYETVTKVSSTDDTQSSSTDGTQSSSTKSENGDTYFDNTTGLWWSNDRGTYQHAAGEAHCEELIYNDRDDWRMPDIYELLAVRVQIGFENSSGVIRVNSKAIWSSTARHTSAAYYIWNGSDEQMETSTGLPLSVLCVRSDDASDND